MMKMSRIFACIAIVVVVAFLSGCSMYDGVEKIDEKEREVQTSYSKEIGKHLISAMDKNGNLPDKGVLNGINYEINKDNIWGYKYRGYYIDSLNQPNAPYYYVICSGERSTGGYDIHVVNLEMDDDNNLFITVEETSPAFHEVVTEALTYPACVVSVYPHPKNVYIKDTDGVEFKYLNYLPVN